MSEKDFGTFSGFHENLPSPERRQQFSYQNPFFPCLADRQFFPEMTEMHMEEHWHEELEYLLVRDGELFCTVNGTVFTLHAGEGAFIGPKRIHSNRSPRGSHCDLCYIIVHPANVNASPYIEQKYITPLFGPTGPDFLLLQEDSWTAPILQELLSLFDKPFEEGMELEILESSYKILRYLYLSLKPERMAPSLPSAYDTAFKAMLSYIQEHFSEKVSLDDIADAGHVGKTLCAKIFRRYTKETPGDYLIHYRIARAMEFLRDTDLSITEIAYKVGFANASHFTKTFRVSSNETPNQYRKREKKA